MYRYATNCAVRAGSLSRPRRFLAGDADCAWGERGGRSTARMRKCVTCLVAAPEAAGGNAARVVRAATRVETTSIQVCSPAVGLRHVYGGRQRPSVGGRGIRKLPLESGKAAGRRRVGPRERMPQEAQVLVVEPVRGLEPLTTALQVACSVPPELSHA